MGLKPPYIIKKNILFVKVALSLNKTNSKKPISSWICNAQLGYKNVYTVNCLPLGFKACKQSYVICIKLESLQNSSNTSKRNTQWSWNDMTTGVRIQVNAS